MVPCFQIRIHEVVSASSMHMDINEPMGQILPLPIHTRCSRSSTEREGLLAALDAYMACGEGFEDGAGFLGIHVEGPYLAAAQCGAQDPRYIRRPERKEYEEMIERCPRILRWTIAPEIPGALEMGDYLMTKGIVPCIGHSDATCEEVRKALLHGYSHITHLYSAMSTIVRRQGFRHAGIILIASGRLAPPC